MMLKFNIAEYQDGSLFYSAVRNNTILMVFLVLVQSHETDMVVSCGRADCDDGFRTAMAIEKTDGWLSSSARLA